MQNVFYWNSDKNEQLVKARGISFEVIIAHIAEGNVLAVIPGHGKFKHQKQLIVLVNQYVYIVPCVEDQDKVYLKTIIPSRKMTKRFLLGDSENET